MLWSYFLTLQLKVDSKALLPVKTGLQSSDECLDVVRRGVTTHGNTQCAIGAIRADAHSSKNMAGRKRMRGTSRTARHPEAHHVQAKNQGLAFKTINDNVNDVGKERPHRDVDRRRDTGNSRKLRIQTIAQDSQSD